MRGRGEGRQRGRPRTNRAGTHPGSFTQMGGWEGFGSLGADGAVFRQAGRGSPSHPDSKESSFQGALLNRPPRSSLPRRFGGGDCHAGGSMGNPRHPKRLFLAFEALPRSLPEAAVSRVNLGQFKESSSGARLMMNVEAITGEAPWSSLKLNSPM